MKYTEADASAMEESASKRRRDFHARLTEFASLSPDPQVMSAALGLVKEAYEDGFRDGWHSAPREEHELDAELEYGAPTVIKLVESSLVTKHDGMAMTLRDEVARRDIAVIRQSRDNGWVVQRGETNSIHMPQAMAEKMKAGNS